MLTQNLVDFVA